MYNYILNHSFKVETSVYDAFIDWIKAYCDKQSYNYQLANMVVPHDDEGATMILQVNISSSQELGVKYVEAYQSDFQLSLYVAFHSKVLSFITLMQKI